MSNTIKITYDQLVNNPPVIEQKFVLIDSSLYTDEAYEYLLSIINQSDSIAFIRDKRKIYTHGTFYGDLWEDVIFYFNKFQIIDNDNNDVLSTLEAEVQNETLRLKGTNNIKLISNEEIIDGKKYKTLEFKYDIENAIDKTFIDINDNTAKLNLNVKDNKILINKYIPIRIETPNLNLIEYDSNIVDYTFKLNIIGSDENKKVVITSNNANINISSDYKTVNSHIRQKNILTNYLILYSDSQIEKSITISHKYGYGIAYSSSDEITPDNFIYCEKYIVDESCEGIINLNLNENKYGWFACPSFFYPIFLDKDSHIIGGWKKIKTFKVYTLNIEYTLYRTEQSGLGKICWEIINKN